MNPLAHSGKVTDNNSLRDTDPQRAATGAATNPELNAIAEALAKLPEDEREAVANHLRRLVDLSPAKRAAILTLTER